VITGTDRKVLVICTSADLAAEYEAHLTGSEFQPIVMSGQLTAMDVMHTLARHSFWAAIVNGPVKPADGARILATVLKHIEKSAKILVSENWLDQQSMTRLLNTGSIESYPDSEPPAAVVLQLNAPKRTTPRYDVNVINCFVTAATDVMEYYVGVKPESEKVTVSASKKVPAGFVAAIVNFSGELGGEASFSCQKAFIIDIASRVNGRSNREIATDQAAMLQTMEEISDQIFGKAELLLGKLGYILKVGSPKVQMSVGADFELKGSGPAVVIPFTLNSNRFFVGFSLAVRKS
jgi:CheY-specific phosphatase CheX